MGRRMFPAKIYVGQITIVFGIVVASTWGATQWTAAALGFQARLGEPWFVVAAYPVYLPWRLFEWWFAYEAYAPEIFEKGGASAAKSARDDLRLGAVGEHEGDPGGGSVRSKGRVSWSSRKHLPAP